MPAALKTYSRDARKDRPQFTADYNESQRKHASQLGEMCAKRARVVDARQKNPLDLRTRAIFGGELPVGTMVLPEIPSAKK